MENIERRKKLEIIFKSYPSEIKEQGTTSERAVIQITPNQWAQVWISGRYNQKADALTFDIFGDEQPYKYQRQTINISTKKTAEQIGAEFKRRGVESETTKANEELINKEKAYKENQAKGLANSKAMFENHGFVFSDRQKKEPYKATISGWTEESPVRYEIEAHTDYLYNSLKISGLSESEWHEVLTVFNSIKNKHEGK